MAVQRKQDPERPLSPKSTNSAVPSAREYAACCTKWRIIVWSLFIIFLLTVGLAAYLLLTSVEEKDFEEAFHQTADLSLDAMDESIQNIMSLFQTFAISVSAVAPTNAWPYVLVPNYSQQAKNLMVLSRADMVVISPLVASTTEWERYVAQGPQATTNITTYAFRLQDGVRVQDFTLVEGYMAPVWQYESVDVLLTTNSVINYNLFQTTWIQDLLLASLKDKEVKISNILNDGDHQELEKLGIIPFRLPGQDTWSLLAQPILSTAEEFQVVGFLISIIPWGPTLFEHRTAPPEETILCVLRDTATGRSFTYLVEGSRANYLGPGDSWVRERGYGTGASSGRRRKLLLSKPFAVEIYPTKEFHDAYTSSLPEIYTAIVVLLFLLVAVVFLLFEHCHDRETYQKLKTEETASMLQTQTSNEAIKVASSPTNNALNNSSRRSSSVRGSIYKKKENNRQLLNAFLADQKRSHDLVGLDDSMLDESTTNVDEPNGFARDNSMNYSSYRSSAKKRTDKENLEALLPSWHESKAIADLFPSASVMFADIAGFTAWSSVREPSKAFTLLEILYHAFDQLAQRRRVFKVETIGDTYTAVCGLPERRPDHAVTLCQFARGCMKRFRRLTHLLEQKLGPETSELSLRVGINSGPVMAGIVRQGSTASFQLFGDTHTMASKIEGSGQPGKIHISKETATQLKDHGKEHWLEPREDKIMTTKGEVQTFWLLDSAQARLKSSSSRPALQMHHSLSSELSDDSVCDRSDWECRGSKSGQALNGKDDDIEDEANSKMMRLVAWNCEVMIPLLKMIKSRRAAENVKRMNANRSRGNVVKQLEATIGSHNNVLDEVEEVISLPRYDAQVQKKIKSDPQKVRLGPKVEDELREYVRLIAKMYNPNPFHNFEHASHVTMSTCKLLSRIVAPEEVMESTTGKKKQDVASELHDYTYGITSDPLTQFAVIFSALIHDVDHRGVPNNILCEEEKEMAALYDNKSVAEQNSTDIAWEMLMDDRFKHLRKCIYGDDEQELRRFRQLVVNCIMSTDIFDKQLSALRRSRWEKAFSIPDEQANAEDINRKATIVIEHLIQASDVSHTMQHWHVYQKWNEYLFYEMYSAYRLGRSDKDPSEGWYKGEIWFFDNYVIPLAKKLHQCGVFGVSSDEYLTYALANREEWEAKGTEIVANLIDKYSAVMDVETK